jgi:transposase-like protein
MSDKNPSCPICQKKSSVKKYGHTNRGLQRYYCGICKRTFTSLKPIIQYDESSILDSWINGNEKLNQTAQRFKISLYRLKKIIKNRYKETLEDMRQDKQNKNDYTESENMKESEINLLKSKNPINFSLLKQRLRKEAKDKKNNS